MSALPKDLNGIPRSKFDGRGREHLRWLGEEKAAVWKPLQEEEAKGQFVPKANVPCNCGNGLHTRFEAQCKTCRESQKEEGLQFAAKSRSLERLASDFLKARGVKVNRRGEVFEVVKGSPDGENGELPKPWRPSRPDSAAALKREPQR